MVNAGSCRISPLLAQPGREADLPYAPAPWMLKQCLETGMIFLANPPAYEALSETYAYERTFLQAADARRQAEPIRFRFSAQLKRFRKFVMKRHKMLAMLHERIADAASPQVNVLDVGCGWGELLQLMMASLPQHLHGRVLPHGVEISRELARLSNARLAPLGGRCVHASARDGLLMFADDYFDVIVMASYLEHEASPLAVLENCRARLREDGCIIVKVPNFDCYNRKLRGPRWSGFRWPDHVNYFTPATLRAMAALAGLEVVRMSALDTSPFSDNMYAVLQARKDTGGGKS